MPFIFCHLHTKKSIFSKRKLKVEKPDTMIPNKFIQKVEELKQKALIIDGHSDILIPMTEGKMDVAERVAIPDIEHWPAPPGLSQHPLALFGIAPHTIYFGCMGQYDIPRWQEGGVDNQVCAIYLDDSKLKNPFQSGMEMVQVFHKAIEQNEELLLCTTVADILEAKKKGKIGLTLSFEGCEALGTDINMLDLYYKLGLRMVSLTHTRRNNYADGCWGADQQGGLTPMGKALIQKLLDLNIVIDLVHIGEKGFWEILELSNQPVVLSHSTPTMFPNSDPTSDYLMNGKVPRPRLELPRDRAMLEALAKNGGVLGLIWACHKNIDAVIKDIELALEVMGPDHIGLGSDLYGQEMAPNGLEDISKVPSIIYKLLERGHSDELILKFLGENYLRVFKTVWGQ